MMILRLVIRRKKQRRWARPEDYTYLQTFTPKELAVGRFYPKKGGRA